MQVSAALKRLRNQRLVQYGLIGAAALALVVLATLWISGSKGKPAGPVGGETAQQETVAAGIAATLREARQAMDQGDLQIALQQVSAVEAREPGNLEARALREEIDRVSRDLAFAAEREQRVSEGLILAREEYSKRRYEQAIAAAQVVLDAVPEHPEAVKLRTDSETGLARQKERQRSALQATAKAAAQAGDDASHPIATPPSKVAVAPPPPPADVNLAIDFASDTSEGVLTIYSGERQILRESFKFVRKTGFLRSEKISGSLAFERTLPAGAIALRVYVSVSGKPTRSIVVEGNLNGGSAQRLEIRVDDDGIATARLR